MHGLQEKGEGWRPCIKSHGNYIVDHGISWKNHGIVFYYFCGNPAAAFQKVLITAIWFLDEIYRGSYMSAHVLLNLLNELGKRV